MHNPTSFIALKLSCLNKDYGCMYVCSWLSIGLSCGHVHKNSHKSKGLCRVPQHVDVDVDVERGWMSFF